MRLDGKVAIVTGGISGIGAATTSLFIELGAKVLCTDIADGGNAFAVRFGGNAAFAEHDVSNPDDWQQVVERAEDEFGPITVLVNNAGISGDLVSADEVSAEDYRRVVEVNQFGVFYGIKAVLPSMQRADGGAIVNISSVAGLFAIPNHLAYSASKFAVTGMTRTAAVDLGKYGIRVNSVHPGAVATPMATRAGVDVLAGEVTKNFPIPRVGQPCEIAKVIAFLASDASSYCTGASFVADGGWTAS